MSHNLFIMTYLYEYTQGNGGKPAIKPMRMKLLWIKKETIMKTINYQEVANRLDFLGFSATEIERHIAKIKVQAENTDLIGDPDDYDADRDYEDYLTNLSSHNEPY